MRMKGFVMVKENCPNAFRKLRDVAIHCKLLNGANDYCAHQYYCPNTGRWEATTLANECPLRKRQLIQDRKE